MNEVSPEVMKVLTEQQALMDELAIIGTPSRAIVAQLTTSKVLINNDGIMAMLIVVVQPQNGKTFLAEFPVALALSNLGNYQTGKSVNVRFDPNDPSRVNLDHARQGGKVSSTD